MVDTLLGAVREAIKGTAEEFRRLIQEDDVGAYGGGHKGGAQQRHDEEGSAHDRDRDRDREGERGAPASLSTKGEGKGHRRIRELFQGLK